MTRKGSEVRVLYGPHFLSRMFTASAVVERRVDGSLTAYLTANHSEQLLHCGLPGVDGGCHLVTVDLGRHASGDVTDDVRDILEPDASGRQQRYGGVAELVGVPGPEAGHPR